MITKMLWCLAILLFCRPDTGKAQPAPNDNKQEEKIRSLISQMTLREKVGLLHANAKFYVSGIKRLGIPEWALSDGPNGVRAEINRDNWAYAGHTDDSATCFPPATTLAATWDPKLAYERGMALGEEARFRKKDVLLGPGINVIRSPLCGRNFEYLGEDPLLISKMSVAYIKGLQSKDVAASVKVFLQPGETKTVALNVKVADLAFYDESKKDWNVETGDFILQLGNSSGNISQTLKIAVK